MTGVFYRSVIHGLGFFIYFIYRDNVAQCFLKEIENMLFVFLSSYRNTRESLGELEKLWKHSPAARVPTAVLVLPKFHSYINNSIETRYMFSIS